MAQNGPKITKNGEMSKGCPNVQFLKMELKNIKIAENSSKQNG